MTVESFAFSFPDPEKEIYLVHNFPNEKYALVKLSTEIHQIPPVRVGKKEYYIDTDWTNAEQCFEITRKYPDGHNLSLGRWHGLMEVLGGLKSKELELSDYFWQKGMPEPYLLSKLVPVIEAYEKSLKEIIKAGDIEEEIYQLTQRADSGDAEAQFIASYELRFDKSIAKYYAFKWLEKAANQGHPYAQTNLGNCFVTGDGVTCDIEEAIKWYRKAAEQGDGGGQFNLATTYFKIKCLSRDYVDAYAYYNLAKVYLNGSAKIDLTLNAFIESLKKKMTPSQIEAGQKRTKELQKEIEANIAKKAGK